MAEVFKELDESCLSEVAELYKSAFAGEPWNDDWSDSTQLMEYIKEVSGAYNALNFGLFIDGRLVAASLGMLRHWWEGTNYNIEEFCVSPEFQSHGIGTRFMEMITENVAERGLSGIFLQTDNDKPAYKFYKKGGFFDLNEHVSMYKKVK